MVNNDRIAVTGGTGHLGACIIQMLLNQGKSVQALYHNYKPLTEHKNLNWVQGDITHIKSLEGFLENSQVLIHCASLISLGKKNKNQVYNINVNGTENIIQSCLRYKVRLKDKNDVQSEEKH